MEQQIGVVVSGGEWAEVRIERQSACLSCGKCGMAADSRILTVRAKNPLLAESGQRVLLSLSMQSALKAGLLVYTLPLLAMFVGAFLGQALAGSIGTILGSFGALALSYLLLHRAESRHKQDSQFDITIARVISAEEEDLCQQMPAQ